MTNEEITWNCKLDAFRPINDYSDLIRVVACYYEMYSKAAEFVGPWIAKQRNGIVFCPDREQVKSFLGKERAYISYNARSRFIDSLITFIKVYKGKKTLITPSISSHHSAQFPSGSFEISQVNEPVFNSTKGSPSGTKIHKIDLAGAEHPIYVENLWMNPSDVKFLIVRPKLGKLGTPNILRWEVMFYKKDHGYIIDHTDSQLNPKWSGIF